MLLYKNSYERNVNCHLVYLPRYSLIFLKRVLRNVGQLKEKKKSNNVCVTHNVFPPLDFAHTSTLSKKEKNNTVYSKFSVAPPMKKNAYKYG